MKSYKSSIVLFIVLILGFMAISWKSTETKLTDATDNSTTWYIPTTSQDTSQIIGVMEVKNICVDWKVTNAGAIAIRLFLLESNNQTDWVATDSSVSITSTVYGMQKFNRIGGAYSMIVAKGYSGNTNSYMEINCFTQE
jgi:hypothetical protein